MSAAQLQRQDIWNIDAIISLRNINATTRRIIAEEKKQITALLQEHPELNCEILVNNLAVLLQINAEESRLLSLPTSAILPAHLDDF